MNLLTELWEYLVDNIKVFPASILMLVLAIIFLPDRVVTPILTRLKPNLIPKDKFMARVRAALYSLIGDSVISLDSTTSDLAQNRIRKIEALVEERRSLSENLFFYDLLRNLSGMLLFVLPQQGYSVDDSISIIDNAMSYITQYSHKIKNTKTFQTERRELDMVAGQLRNSIADVQDYLANHTEAREEISAAALKMNAIQFDSFMKSRWESQNLAWKRISQELAKTLEEHIERSSDE